MLAHCEFLNSSQFLSAGCSGFLARSRESRGVWSSAYLLGRRNSLQESTNDLVGSPHHIWFTLGALKRQGNLEQKIVCLLKKNLQRSLQNDWASMKFSQGSTHFN